MSNPATQNKTARPNHIAGAMSKGCFRSSSPRKAIQVHTGAIIRAAPNHKCTAHVNRLAKLYPPIQSNTGKHKRIGNGFGQNKRQASTKAIAFPTPNPITAVDVNLPDGICRLSVRGFSASNLASAHRLTDIAKLRAVTMQNKIPTHRKTALPPKDVCVGKGTAKVQINERIANGNANMV